MYTATTSNSCIGWENLFNLHAMTLLFFLGIPRYMFKKIIGLFFGTSTQRHFPTTANKVKFYGQNSQRTTTTTTTTTSNNNKQQQAANNKQQAANKHHFVSKKPSSTHTFRNRLRSALSLSSCFAFPGLRPFRLRPFRQARGDDGAQPEVWSYVRETRWLIEVDDVSTTRIDVSNEEKGAASYIYI